MLLDTNYNGWRNFSHSDTFPEGSFGSALDLTGNMMALDTELRILQEKIEAGLLLYDKFDVKLRVRFFSFVFKNFGIRFALFIIGFRAQNFDIVNLTDITLAF